MDKKAYNQLITLDFICGNIFPNRKSFMINKNFRRYLPADAMYKCFCKKNYKGGMFNWTISPGRIFTFE